MTRAQQQLAILVEWVKASSQDCMAPNGRDRIIYGPCAVFVPQALSLPPTPAFAPSHLPLWIPESQGLPNLPPFTQAPPPGQSPVSNRLRGIVWQWEAGRFRGALLGLTCPGETLQSALDRQLPGLDLAEHLALFLPLWLVTEEHAAWIGRRLPLVK